MSMTQAKPSVLLPPASSAPVSTSTSSNGAAPPTITRTSIPVSDDSVIDSALLAALREPRERMALLRLEQVLVNLLHSETDGWIEVGGPSNSVVLWPSGELTQPATSPSMRQTTFQRCILHRLADRFGIVREPGSLLQTNMAQAPSSNISNPLPTGAIRLIKLPHSKIPTTLLQDLDASVYSNNGTGGTYEPNGSGEAQTTPQVAAPSKPRKMKIMKRSDSRGSNQSGKSKNKNNGKNPLLGSGRLSFSDKEKAYAEARARIFQDENPSGELSSHHSQKDDVSEGISSGMAKVSVSGASAAGDSTSSRNGSYQRSSSLHSSTGSLGGASTSSSNNNTNNNNASSGQLQRASDAASPEMTRKAVYRNYAEEAADPDFRRGCRPLPLSAAPGASVVPANAAMTYGGVAAHPQQHHAAGGWPHQQHPHVVPTHAAAAAVPPGSYGRNVVSPVNQQQQYAAVQGNKSWPSVSPSASGGASSSLTASAPAFYPDGGGQQQPSSWRTIATSSTTSGTKPAPLSSSTTPARTSPPANAVTSRTTRPPTTPSAATQASSG